MSTETQAEVKAGASTLLHVLELVASLLAAFVLIKYFNLDPEKYGLVVGVAVNALAKFARTSSLIPIPDYVNGTQE